MLMFDSDYSLAWALYGIAALGCLLFWFRVTRWMWRWLRESLRLAAAVLLFTPIFWPVILSLGIDPLHFGVMLIMNLCIGLCTPPVGTCLFLGCSVANTTVARMLPRLIPFYLAMILVLMVITYLPLVSVALPRWLGVS